MSALPPLPSARCVIADDERLMREQLRARLAEVWPQLQVLAEARNGAEAVALVAEHRPDLVFLDIRMPGLDGVEAARQILQLPPTEDWDGCEIVFITAYDQHAIEAFEQGAADYVLKPAEPERLRRTAERLQRRLSRAGDRGAAVDAAATDRADAAGAGEPPASMPLNELLQRLAAQLDPARAPRHLRWIQASVGASIQMIPVDEVLFFISDEKYTRVQTARQEALIRKPIKELVDELDPQQFWQIHRSTLVNAHAISAVTRDLRGRLLVSVRGHPQSLEVSRSYSGLFKSM